MDNYFFQENQDGTKTLFRVLKDGTNRAVSESYHGYLTFVAAGNIAEIKPYIAPISDPITTVSCLDFWKKLTIQEQIDLENNTKMQTKLYLSAWNKSQVLDYKDPFFMEAMNFFVQEGLLTESRRRELIND